MFIFSIASKSYTQESLNERHTKVVMRMIGHEMLLLSGDSTSRVLPIKKEAGRYKVSFELEFQLNPDQLITTIDCIMQEAQIASSYLVEVEKCEDQEVVYAYATGTAATSDIIPCRTRALPKACYILFVSILDQWKPLESLGTITTQSNNATPSNKINYFTNVSIILPLLILIGLLIYFKKIGFNQKTNPDIIAIGAYLFDKKNMMLSYEGIGTELSSKESDLLFLLYTAANTVLERENILKMVWKDEGDYVGRTLDVFISKLRKKLANDSSLRIINIRGIGYKFVINDR